MGFRILDVVADGRVYDRHVEISAPRCCLKYRALSCCCASRDLMTRMWRGARLFYPFFQSGWFLPCTIFRPRRGQRDVCVMVNYYNLFLKLHFYHVRKNLCIVTAAACSQKLGRDRLQIRWVYELCAEYRRGGYTRASSIDKVSESHTSLKSRPCKVSLASCTSLLY